MSLEGKLKMNKITYLIQEQIDQPILSDPYLDYNPMPPTSANPDTPVDDYPTFLKVMSEKD